MQLPTIEVDCRHVPEHSDATRFCRRARQEYGGCVVPQPDQQSRALHSATTRAKRGGPQQPSPSTSQKRKRVAQRRPKLRTGKKKHALLKLHDEKLPARERTRQIHPHTTASRFL